MRLFVGLDIPDDIAARVMAASAKLREAAPELRWSPRSNLHITTKFVGAWPDERLDELIARLKRITAVPFEVRVEQLGWFPNPHAPRIFWVGVDGGEALRGLAAATDQATAELGAAPEKRSYTPHLTLARVKPEDDIRALRGAVASLPQTGFGQFEAREFHLYRSDPGPAGSVYTKLAAFPFD